LSSGSSCFFQLLPPSLEVDWEGRLGVLVRNLRTVSMVYWVNVFVSSAGCLQLMLEILEISWNLIASPADFYIIDR